MSKYSQFGGNRATTSIVNAWSSSAAAAGLTNVNALGGSPARAVLSGSMTSATYKTLLSVTGAGECSLLALYTADTTSRTLGLRITVDGVVVATMTTAAIVAANSGLLHAAGLYGGPPPIRFNASLLVEALSSVTETDKLTLSYLYNLN